MSVVEFADQGGAANVSPILATFTLFRSANMTDLHLSRTDVERKHRGGWSEMIACCWLLQQGYEVFRNVSSHGTVDVVAVKGDETVFIDVKSCSPIEMKCGSIAASIGGSSDPTGRIVRLFVADDGFCSFSTDEMFFHLTGRKVGDRQRARDDLAREDYWRRFAAVINKTVAATGGNVSEAARLLNSAGVPTTGGTSWTASKLANTLKRHRKALDAFYSSEAGFPAPEAERDVDPLTAASRGIVETDP